MNQKPRLLFVCSRNQWRSPTAERIYRTDPRLAVRSAGLSPRSRHQISTDDLAWADLILVMEQSHKGRLQAMFRDFMPLPPTEVLDIADDYELMDPELIELITSRMQDILNKLLG